MTETKMQSVLFDPGYAQHTTILSISAEYIYEGINKFKNFGQQKMKFKMMYPQILRMVDNNVGFCLGSLLWATYIKSLGDVNIEHNPCIGGTYDETETIEEVDYSIEFFDRLKKNVKHYLGKDYEINPEHIKVLELYKDFLKLNLGFVNTKTTNDILLPEGFKSLNEEDAQKVHAKIEEVISSGNLLDLFEVFSLAYEG